MTDFGTDAARLLAGLEARRSGKGGPGRPEIIPGEFELLAFRRAEHGESQAEIPEWLGSLRPAQVAANQNRRMWLVK